MSKKARTYGLAAALALTAFVAGIAVAGAGGAVSGFGTAPVAAGPDPAGRAPAPAAAARAVSAAVAAVAETVTPAVVRIQTERMPGGTGAARDPFRMPDEPGGVYPELFGGSGFLISPDGLIVTSYHVVEDSDWITVTLWDKRTFDGRLLGADPTTDIALLRINATELPSVRFGDSDAVRVGALVVAVGNPGFRDASTLDFTVTSGIISAKGRPLPVIRRGLSGSADPAALYAIEDFLQTDAVINPGNSGGPLLDLEGKVIGVNSAIASGTGFYAGYGFAVPSNMARRVIDDLLELGRVRRPVLGVRISDVTEEDAEVYALPSIAGVLVEDFPTVSGARDAGMRRHDVIVAVDGEPVDRIARLQRVIARKRPGDSVRVGLIRYGERVDLSIPLAEAELDQPDRAPAPPRARELGIRLRELTPALARELAFDGPGGAVVVSVTPRSPAELEGIGPNLRILAIDREPVESARQAESILSAAPSGRVVSLLLEDSRGNTTIANVRVP